MCNPITTAIFVGRLACFTCGRSLVVLWRFTITGTEFGNSAYINIINNSINNIKLGFFKFFQTDSKSPKGTENIQLNTHSNWPEIAFLSQPEDAKDTKIRTPRLDGNIIKLWQNHNFCPRYLCTCALSLSPCHIN